MYTARMMTRPFTLKLVVMFTAIALLTVLVLAALQLTGMAAQSASAGVVFPIENGMLGMLCVALGAVSVRNVRGYEAAVVPFSFLFLLIASLAVHLDFPVSKPLVFGAVALLLVAVALAYGVRMLGAGMVAGIGAATMNHTSLPVHAGALQPFYFMFGLSISSVILLAAGMCFALAIQGLSFPNAQTPSPVVRFPRLTL